MWPIGDPNLALPHGPRGLARVDGFGLALVDFDQDGAGARFGQVGQHEARHAATDLAFLCRTVPGDEAGSCLERGAAQAVEAVFDRGPDDAANAKAAGREAKHVVVEIGGPGVGDEHVAVPAVAESALKLAAQGARDIVADDDRVAEVSDACDGACFFALRALERGEKTVECVAGAVDDGDRWRLGLDARPVGRRGLTTEASLGPLCTRVRRRGQVQPRGGLRRLSFARLGSRYAGLRRSFQRPTRAAWAGRRAEDAELRPGGGFR